MGCIIKVMIQVLHGNHWITILDFVTKTSCGGYPITTATEELFLRKKILANHGTQFKTLTNTMDATSTILKGLVIEDVIREETAEERWREGKKEDAGEDKNESDDKDVDVDEDGDVDDEDDADEDRELDENEEFLFYTIEQFVELIKFVTNDEKSPGMFYCYEPFIFTRFLTPVPMWCEMARSALPVSTEEIWLTKDKSEIDDVTNRLVAKQKELRALYRDEIVKTFANLPDEIARLIAEFSGPVALDVRVALNDDEGWSKKQIKDEKKYLQTMMEEKKAAQQQQDQQQLQLASLS